MPEILRAPELSADDIPELDALFRICFGGMAFTAGPPADLRAIHRVGSRIAAYAAVSLRRIALQGCQRETAILGLVCVDPQFRGRKLGHEVIAALQAAIPLPFMLNCGAPLVSYYNAIGYRKISDRASYTRSGGVVIDNDPVMLNPNGQQAAAVMQSAPVYLGRDF
ncbi:MAG: hypothetical protein R3F07_15965 [Opitutaceae bacterium]